MQVVPLPSGFAPPRPAIEGCLIGVTEPLGADEENLYRNIGSLRRQIEWRKGSNDLG
jgi:hypothetical protein